MILKLLLSLYWVTKIRPEVVRYLDERLLKFPDKNRLEIDKRFGADSHLIFEQFLLKPLRDKTIADIDKAIEKLK